MEKGGAQDVACAPRREWLEDELEPELPEAREVRLTGDRLVDPSEIKARRVGVVESALVVLRRVEQVIGFPAELELHSLVDAEGLGEVDVELLERRAANVRVADRQHASHVLFADDERRRGAAGLDRVGCQRISRITIGVALI